MKEWRIGKLSRAESEMEEMKYRSLMTANEIRKRFKEWIVWFRRPVLKIKLVQLFTDDNKVVIISLWYPHDLVLRWQMGTPCECNGMDHKVHLNLAVVGLFHYAQQLWLHLSPRWLSHKPSINMQMVTWIFQPWLAAVGLGADLKVTPAVFKVKPNVCMLLRRKRGRDRGREGESGREDRMLNSSV